MKAIYKGNFDRPECRDFEIGESYFVRVCTGYKSGKNILVIKFDNGFKLHYGSIQNFMKDWKLVDDEDPAFIEKLSERDERIERLWEWFEDIPMNPETECIEGDFMHFPAGTHREVVWKWFDERYSKGVHHLMYGW